MASSLRVNAIVPASGTNVAIGTAGGTVTYNASVSGVSTFSSGLYVTGGSVGIGTDNPTEKLNVEGKSIFTSRSFSNNLVISPNNHSAGTDIECFNNGNSAKKSISLNPYGGNVGVGVTNPSNIFQVTPSGLSAALSVDSSGRVTKPNQPAFSVYPAAGTPIGSGTIIFTGVRFNIGSHYSTSTGRFTAPVSGIYLIVLTSQHYGGTATNGWIDIRINGAEVNARYEPFDGAQYTAGGISAIVQMSADDYATIVTSGNVFHDDNTNFSGYLLG